MHRVSACDHCRGPVACIGSERAKMSGAVGERLREASSINLSLTTLGRVIRGITAGQACVPYRESKLTHLLQASQAACLLSISIADLPLHH